jgi:uncharacterized membrane protein YtjA (UPF0391 family)
VNKQRIHKFRAARRRVIHRERSFSWHMVRCGEAGTELFVRPVFLLRKAQPRSRIWARRCSICEVTIMLNLVVTLLIIALIAAVLGFGGIASTAVGLAKIVFFVALLLFLIAALFGMMRGPRAL